VDLERIENAGRKYFPNSAFLLFIYFYFLKDPRNPLRDSCRIGGVETLAVGGGAVHAANFFFFFTDKGGLFNPAQDNAYSTQNKRLC
jgi:hypothetical protein